MRVVGWLIPNGPNRKLPASRSSRLPNTLGASKRGTQSQSIAPSGATSAPVWQSDRNAKSAIGGNGEGAAALRSWHASAAFRAGALFLATLMRSVLHLEASTTRTQRMPIRNCYKDALRPELFHVVFGNNSGPIAVG